MSSYRRVLNHIIFRTKSGKRTLNQQYSKELYAYIMGIIQNKKGFLYRINGMEDHIHILTDLHPSIALADLVRDIKSSSSVWLKEKGINNLFEGWAEGYAAFTYAWNDKDKIVTYIKNQHEHHKKTSFEDELKELLIEHGVSYDEKFFP